VIDPKCCRCGEELRENGGVLLTEPRATVSIMGGRLVGDLVPKLHLCVPCTARVIAFLAGDDGAWQDVRDEWSDAIEAAHPARGSESHDEYGVAMRMVGNRHSKGELLALVNWLLVLNGALGGDLVREAVR